MTAATEKMKRDYSLVGESTRTGDRDRARLGRVVSHRRSAQGDEGADAALRRAGDPRHDHLDRAHPRLGGRRHLVLGHVVVRAVLLRLRRPLRLLERLALARMRARHRLQDALDERRRLPDRQLHADAQPGDLALEPRAPSHRHDHRRPRRRDRRDAAARSAADGTGLLRHSRLPLRAADAFPQCLRQSVGGREELHPRDGAAQGGRRCALARRDLCRDHRACALHVVVAAADADRPAAALRHAGTWC